MGWKKTDALFNTQANRQGLGKALNAGMVCQEAERLYPQLFKATSLVGNTIRISVLVENQMSFRLIEGKLLIELKAFAEPRTLPVPTRCQLTITQEPDTL
jgi:hypothetical protein